MKELKKIDLPKDWKIKNIKSVGDVVTGTTPQSNNSDFYCEEGFLWASPADLGKGKYVNYTKKQLTELGFNQTRKLPPLSIMITCIGSTIGKIGMTNSWMSTNQQINSLVCNEDNSSEFYYYVMEYMASYIKSLAGTQAVPLLNKTDFSIINIPNPPLPEQQKIAEILSIVDAKIEVIAQQITETQALKKGLMQRLLTKGIGHTEFKDSPLGEIPKSWEVVKQSEVAVFYNGRAYKLTEWEKEGTPVIRLQNLTGTGKNYYYSNLELPEHQYCYNGDLLYMWSATFGPVWWFGEKAIFHYHIWKIEHNPLFINKKFHYYLLDDVTTRMKNESHGSTMLHVTKGGMEKLLIQLPSLSEQQKIAEILSSVDDKLEVLSEKKTYYQELKQGLMQQLLTGKIRVTV